MKQSKKTDGQTALKSRVGQWVATFKEAVLPSFPKERGVVIGVVREGAELRCVCGNPGKQ